jgi:hypothetical protein
VKRCEKDVSLSPINHQTTKPFKGHQALGPSVGHRVEVFPSPSSFFFSLNGKFGSFGAFFSRHNFLFEY